MGKDWNAYLIRWRELVANHEDYPSTSTVGTEEVAHGRIHYLTANGLPDKTIAYHSKTELQTAVKQVHKDGERAVVETQAQIDSLNRERERMEAKMQSQNDLELG